MGRKWCLNCEQFVETKKTFHGVAFVLLMIFVWIPLLCIEFALFAVGTASYSYGFTPSPALGGISFLMFVVTFFTPFVYVLYHLFGKEAKCPVCNGTNFTETNPKIAKKLE